MALTALARRQLANALNDLGAANEVADALDGAATPAIGAALTAQLTTLTLANAEGTPDYAVQAVINTNAWGLASEQELITLLYVVKNLQVRLAEVEARLEAAAVVTAN